MEHCHFTPVGPNRFVCDVCGMPEYIPEGTSVERVCLGERKREQVLLAVPFSVSPPAPPPYIPCRYRGQINELIDCKPCEAEGRTVVVWACTIHRECVMHNVRKTKLDGTRWKACATCEERTDPIEMR